VITIGRIVEHLHGRLEGRTFPDERNELLGQGLTRFRPHPRTRAAAHDDGEYFRHDPPFNEERRLGIGVAPESGRRRTRELVEIP